MLEICPLIYCDVVVFFLKKNKPSMNSVFCKVTEIQTTAEACWHHTTTCSAQKCAQDWQQSLHITFTVTVMYLTLVFILAYPLKDVNKQWHSYTYSTQTHTHNILLLHISLFLVWHLTIWNGGSIDDQPSAVIGSLVTQQIHVSVGHMGY